MQVNLLWRRIITLLLAAAAIPGIAACVDVQEPGAPDVILPENPGECSSTCECGDLTNRAFRLTKLEIDEPEEFADILNMIWKTDIRSNLLNVIFYVTKAVPGTIHAFDSIMITAGPGWRKPKEPLRLDPVGDESSATVVESYCILEGMDVDFKLENYHGYQCMVKSEEDTLLFFHTGPLDHPLVCAPKLNPRNNIPIKNLKFRSGFNTDCTALQNAYLEGCITIEDANHICMCIGEYENCAQDFDYDVEFDPNNLTKYCEDACGSGWTSFGSLVDVFGLFPTCITPEGNQGYRLQGFIAAEEITDKFNPVQSGDCMTE